MIYFQIDRNDRKIPFHLLISSLSLSPSIIQTLFNCSTINCHLILSLGQESAKPLRNKLCQSEFKVLQKLFKKALLH